MLQLDIMYALRALLRYIASLLVTENQGSDTLAYILNHPVYAT